MSDTDPNSDIPFKKDLPKISDGEDDDDDDVMVVADDVFRGEEYEKFQKSEAKVVYVTMMVAKRRINVNYIQKIFSQYGEMIRIVIYRDSAIRVFVEFMSHLSAKLLVCCVNKKKLEKEEGYVLAQLSAKRALNVTANTEFTWDKMKENLAIVPTKEFASTDTPASLTKDVGIPVDMTANRSSSSESQSSLLPSNTLPANKPDSQQFAAPSENLEKRPASSSDGRSSSIQQGTTDADKGSKRTKTGERDERDETDSPRMSLEEMLQRAGYKRDRAFVVTTFIPPPDE